MINRFLRRLSAALKPEPVGTLPCGAPCRYWIGDGWVWHDCGCGECKPPKPPPEPLTIFAVFDDGMLVAATARPHQAQALARLGHEVRRVTFDRNAAPVLEKP